MVTILLNFPFPPHLVQVSISWLCISLRLPTLTVPSPSHSRQIIILLSVFILFVFRKTVKASRGVLKPIIFNLNLDYEAPAAFPPLPSLSGKFLFLKRGGRYNRHAAPELIVKYERTRRVESIARLFVFSLISGTGFKRKPARAKIGRMRNPGQLKQTLCFNFKY